MGEINLYDVHSMLNKLGIPINYNETMALIASSNNRNSEALNLEEFMHIIFSDNSAVDYDLNKINFKEEKVYAEGEQIDKLKKKMKDCLVETSKTNELNFLKEYLRIRIPGLVKYFNEVAEQNGLCNYDSLAEVIKRFTLPEKYKSAPMIDAIYSQYSIEESNLMDYKKFIDDIIYSKDSNYFFNFKDHYLKKVEDKIEGSSQTVLDYINSLKSEYERKRILLGESTNGIPKKMELDQDTSRKEINSSVPSTGFVNKIFANRDIYFKRHQELTDNFSPHPSFINGKMFLIA